MLPQAHAPRHKTDPHVANHERFGGGPRGRLIVRGLNGFRRRSIDGGGPKPTGRLTPLAGLMDEKVVEWKLVAGLEETTVAASCASACGSGDVWRAGELEKQAYRLDPGSCLVSMTVGREMGLASAILWLASSGSMAVFVRLLKMG
jgi:hypothetical protein